MEEEMLAACSALIIVAILRKKKRKPREIWVKKWLMKRDKKSAYNTILQELRLDDKANFRRYLRMNTDTFDELVRLVKPHIEKKCTRLRKPLGVEEKLACTLRYLATGESFVSLQFQFRISKAAISIFVPEVCLAIYIALKDVYLRFPQTEEEWIEVSKNIYNYWQFPNSLGAMDGKHIAIFNPPSAGSTFYNYKGFYSVVLLALVKQYYQFLYVDVGCQGRVSDGGVFKNSDLFHGIQSDTLNIPKPVPLPKTGDPCWDEDEYPSIPYMIVGDDAFQLTDYMMKPYALKQNISEEQLIFNYRLSRFR